MIRGWRFARKDCVLSEKINKSRTWAMRMKKDSGAKGEKEDY